MATGERVKSDAPGSKFEPVEVQDGLWKVKLVHGKGHIRIGAEKRHGEADSLFLEVGGQRRFEIGNDCNTCHFWFKSLVDPRPGSQKKIANLPKTLSLPRRLDAGMIQEFSPLVDILDKGEYYLFSTAVHLAGPYSADDEQSYFFNNEFLELWGIDDPAEENLLSDWEHYEGAKPRLYRHQGLLEKQFDFIVPLVPRRSLKDEYIKLYQQMIAAGDRPRILVLGMLQRPVPKSVYRGEHNNLHSFFAGYVLDGHHKLAAYRRADVPVPMMVLLAQKASKYALLKEEGTNAKAKFEERLAAIAI